MFGKVNKLGGGGMKQTTITRTLSWAASYNTLTYNKTDLGLSAEDTILYADTQMAVMDDYTGLYLQTTFTDASVTIGYKKAATSSAAVKTTVFYR
jgi:hypothetical protein